MPTEQIRVDVREGVGTVVLSRPQRKNALTVVMRDEVVACLTDWRTDPAVSAVVLRGDGGCFCAGFDREELLSLDSAVRWRVYQSSKVYHRAVVYFPKPLIAAVDGVAFGAGLDLALLCDVRVAAEGSCFGHPDVKLGMQPLYTPLRRVVGESWARDMCLTGRRVYAADALRIGIVTYVTAAEDLAAFADTVARRVIEAPGDVLKLTKSFFHDAGPHSPEAFLAREHDQPFEQTYGLTATPPMGVR